MMRHSHRGGTSALEPGLPLERPPHSSLQDSIGVILMSSSFESFAGCVILANFVVIVIETDYRALQRIAPPGSSDHALANESLRVIKMINTIFLVLYCLESVLRFYVQRWEFFKYGWNNFDLSIICLGVTGEVLALALDGSSIENMQLLRSIRMVRLLRLSRVLVSFQELYALVCGLTSCVRTLMWAAGLILMTLTVWSIISVEYLSPLMMEIEEAGMYSTCSWCPTAFDSIMLSNLTFFQIISGDGWSTLGRALIEKHPWAALIFVAVIFMVVFGQLNLIIAAIVDTAAMAREDDVQTLAKRRESERTSTWNAFVLLCLDLDEDGSGDITLEELKAGIETSQELKAYMAVLGIDNDDIDQIFELLDVDGDGMITHLEFCTQLYKMRTAEVKTNVHRVKHYVDRIWEAVTDTEMRVRRLEKQITGEVIEARCGSKTLQERPWSPQSHSVSHSPRGKTGTDSGCESFSLDAPPSKNVADPPFEQKLRIGPPPLALQLPYGWYYFGQTPPTHDTSNAYDIAESLLAEEFAVAHEAPWHSQYSLRSGAESRRDGIIPPNAPSAWKAKLGHSPFQPASTGAPSSAGSGQPGGQPGGQGVMVGGGSSMPTLAAVQQAMNLPGAPSAVQDAWRKPGAASVLQVPQYGGGAAHPQFAPPAGVPLRSAGAGAMPPLHPIPRDLHSALRSASAGGRYSQDPVCDCSKMACGTSDRIRADAKARQADTLNS